MLHQRMPSFDSSILEKTVITHPGLTRIAEAKLAVLESAMFKSYSSEKTVTAPASKQSSLKQMVSQSGGFPPKPRVLKVHCEIIAPSV